MRKALVAANWKMYGDQLFTKELLIGLQESISSSCLNNTDIVICPPFTYLHLASDLLGKEIKLGAQDVSAHSAGAYTGQISAAMLKDISCSYVIVGHSERRQYCGESNELVAQKFFAAKEAGLTPILCIGETDEERELGKTESVVLQQLGAIIDKYGVSGLENSVIAYEPIWAIGTGKTASPEEAQAVHSILRENVANLDSSLANSLQILYGGSVKAENAQSLFSMPDIDGGLIGGASLKVSDFSAICEAALSVSK